MKTILKYPLKVTDSQDVLMPVGAQILCVQMQRETPCLWVMVDRDWRKQAPVKVTTCGTGHNATEPFGDYIGTYQMENTVVFHVFAAAQEGK